jgi:hypothetical protein
MENNVHRFDGRASEYARYRERYALEVLLPRLREWCGLTSDWTVADVGAGTGMLSDVFMANGNRVVAVEPNAEMRQMCLSLHEGHRGLRLSTGRLRLRDLLTHPSRWLRLVGPFIGSILNARRLNFGAF